MHAERAVDELRAPHKAEFPGARAAHFLCRIGLHMPLQRFCWPTMCADRPCYSNYSGNATRGPGQAHSSADGVSAPRILSGKDQPCNSMRRQ